MTKKVSVMKFKVYFMLPVSDVTSDVESLEEFIKSEKLDRENIGERKPRAREERLAASIARKKS